MIVEMEKKTLTDIHKIKSTVLYIAHSKQFEKGEYFNGNKQLNLLYYTFFSEINKLPYH